MHGPSTFGLYQKVRVNEAIPSVTGEAGAESCVISGNVYETSQKQVEKESHFGVKRGGEAKEVFQKKGAHDD